MKFCSREARAQGAILAGTAVRGDTYIFAPVPKRLWRAGELNEAWASPEEAEAIRAARQAGVVTRLYNPVSTEAAVLVHRGPAAEDAALAPLLALLSRRWAVDEGGAPRLAICTHGTRDRCCAKWGFAVYREALRLFRAGLSPFEPLESSHLGGDRYAATGIFFPSGGMYAHLDGADLQAVVGAEASGRIAAEWYRGRVFEGQLTQIVRAGLARDGWADSADARLTLGEEEAEPRRVRVSVEGGARVFSVSLGLAEATFHASCAALERGRVSRQRRTVYLGAELEAP